MMQQYCAKVRVDPEGWIILRFDTEAQVVTMKLAPEHAKKLAAMLLSGAIASEQGVPPT